DRPRTTCTATCTRARSACSPWPPNRGSACETTSCAPATSTPSTASATSDPTPSPHFADQVVVRERSQAAPNDHLVGKVGGGVGSGDGQAAVDDELLACHERRGVAGEEHGRPGHLLRPRPA